MQKSAATKERSVDSSGVTGGGNMHVLPNRTLDRFLMKGSVYLVGAGGGGGGARSPNCS